jgi:predicted amidophosphoribosyltransferase
MADSRKCSNCGAPVRASQQMCFKCSMAEVNAKGNAILSMPKLERVAGKLTPHFFELTPCAVCDPELRGSFGFDGPRGKIASSIRETLRRQGSYSPGGLVQFWQRYREHLCKSCQSKLETIQPIKQKALSLLEESVRIDPKNEPAKKNLTALRSML